ncbi:MAG: UDP-N-acetylmuramate dehydrogenase [Candidatus Daviesbacteria bacterium]|nr:UDP-N-acetylmuramate dehydrogenase [Candidatus Daviesbacteria bacterium]
MQNPQENISLKEFTTFKIGGPAKYFCRAKSVEDIIEALKWAQGRKLAFFILGGGSNLLISDEGFAGLVIKNELNNLRLQGDALEAQSGVQLSALINFAVANNLSGLQKLTGIYGTVGGAVFGNAGAYGQTISDYLTEVICLQNGKIITLSKEQCEFGYRDSAFKRNSCIILEVHFKLSVSEGKVLQEQVQEFASQRQAKFPSSLKCPGSFFKNIPVDPAVAGLKLIPQDKINHGKIPAAILLEMVGAKGKKVGDIKVSSYHANLIINEGEGQAKDVWKLAHDLSQAVKEKFGITLEPEVQFINLPPLT